MRRAGSGRAGDLRGGVGVLSGLGWASYLRTIPNFICGRSLCVGSQIGDGLTAGGFLYINLLAAPQRNLRHVPPTIRLRNRFVEFPLPEQDYFRR